MWKRIAALFREPTHREEVERAARYATTNERDARRLTDALNTDAGRRVSWGIPLKAALRYYDDSWCTRWIAPHRGHLSSPEVDKFIAVVEDAKQRFEVEQRRHERIIRNDRASLGMRIDAMRWFLDTTRFPRMDAVVDVVDRAGRTPGLQALAHMGILALRWQRHVAGAPVLNRLLRDPRVDTLVRQQILASMIWGIADDESAPACRYAAKRFDLSIAGDVANILEGRDERDVRGSDGFCNFLGDMTRFAHGGGVT